MINRTKVKESTQIKPGDNGDVLVMKDNAPEWSTPSDADLAKASETDTKLAEKQDKLTAGDNIHIVGNTISADGKPTPIAIGTVTSGEVPMVSNSGTDTDVVLNFVLPKGDKGDKGDQGLQGPQGNPGAAAGFGNVTATVDNTTGTPQVSVQADGPNTAKNISFSFTGLKGEKGEKGDPGGAGAEVNNLAPLVVDTAPTSSNAGSVAIGNGAISSGTNGAGIAIGENAYSGINGGTVIGVNARSEDNQGVGVIIGDYAFGTRGVNIGTHASVRPTSMPSIADSIGSYAEVPRSVSSTYNYCVALGSYSVATEGKTVSVGSGSSALTLSDDMTEEQKAIARAAGEVPTRRIVNVTDPRDAQDAATKNYVDTQLEPISAKLQYVPENTNQILSQIQTNVEKAQSAADAKVASITAGTGISVDVSNPTAPVVSTTGLATQADLTALQTTVTQLQATVTQLQATINNLTLETERI